MGGSYSHELCQATPPKEDKFQKHLPIDPRSPSTDITRTPIIVDKTPEGALDPALDPRSPTAGIYRTPLTSLPGSKEGEFTFCPWKIFQAVGSGHCPMNSKYGPSLSKAVGPVDPSFSVVEKSHFDKIFILWRVYNFHKTESTM